MDLSALEGQELAEVTFVRNYLQLRFDGPSLTLYHWPEVYIASDSGIAEGSYAFGEPGYRDALCLQIGESVSRTSLQEDHALEIEFENGTIFRSSLRAEDYEGSEAGHFSSGESDDPPIVF